MTTFTKGDEVFDIHGRKAAYIAGYAGGHIVAPEYERESGESYWGEPETWREIFTKPPTEKLEARVGELEALIAERRAELKRVNVELDEAGKRYELQLKKAAKHQALQHIEDYLDGKFMYFLRVPEYSPPTMVTINEALDQHDRYDKKLKLLSWFGDTNGNLQGQINRYRDGSGDWEEVYPCKTEEEAIAIIRRLYAEDVAKWRERPADMKHFGRAISWTALPAGFIEIPDDVAAYLADAKEACRLKEINSLTEKIAEAQKKLQELQPC